MSVLNFLVMQIGNKKIDFFRLAMFWRTFYGALRLLFGLALLKLIHVPLIDLLYKIMRSELIEDPTDFLFTVANGFLQLHPIYITYFISAYLIFWGIIDIVISISLLKHKKWAFPTSFWLIGFFVIYELYRFTYTNSYILLGIIFVDLLILWVIWKEYKKM